MAKRTEEDIAMRPKGFRRLFNQRFVQAMEVFGYLLCSLIGLGLVYGVWMKVDVVVPCEGVLLAPSSIINAPDDLTITTWAVEPGQQAAAGATLCSYVSDPAQRDTARARTLITHAMAALVDNDPRTQSAEDYCKQALEALPGIDREVRMSSPSVGIAVPSPAAIPGAHVPKDALVARVVDVTRLELKGFVTGGSATKVAQGNPVRITDPLSGKELKGEVANVERQDNTANLVLTFTPLAEEVAEKYKQEALHPETAMPPARINASIVVGQQSLFKSVLGRR